MKEINYETLLEAGFEPCIFAPIYLSRYCFYLGEVDWETKDFLKCPMMLAERTDGKWVNDFQDSDILFSTIEEIVSYCKEKNIVMVGSPSPYRKVVIDSQTKI